MLPIHCLTSLVNANLQHSPGFQFEIFVDGLDAQIFGPGKDGLDPILLKFLYHQALLKRKFLGNGLVYYLRKGFGRLICELIQLRILKEYDHQQVLL